MSTVMPAIQELAGDSSHYVRSNLAGVVLELAPKLGKVSTLETLLPVCLSLLSDEYPEVRLAVISKLDQVSQASTKYFMLLKFLLSFNTSSIGDCRLSVSSSLRKVFCPQSRNWQKISTGECDLL